MSLSLILFPLLFTLLGGIISNYMLRSLFFVLGMAITFAFTVYAYFNISFFSEAPYITLTETGIYPMLTLSGVFMIIALHYVISQFYDDAQPNISPHNHVAFTTLSPAILSVLYLYILATDWFLILAAIFLLIALLGILFYIFHKTIRIRTLIRFFFVAATACAFITFGIILLSLKVATPYPEAPIALDTYTHVINLGIFALILGFGIFIGIAPTHAWLPEFVVHPVAPLTALTSATLVCIGTWGFQRLTTLCDFFLSPTILSPALLAFGIATLAIGAIFSTMQLNYKRLTAYILIAQCGLLMIAFSKVNEVSLQMCISLEAWQIIASTLLYLLAGNIHRIIGSDTSMDAMKLFKLAPITSLFWILCILAFCALPPFTIFNIMEKIISESFAEKAYFTIIAVSISEIILFASASAHLLTMLKQHPFRKPHSLKHESALLCISPMVLMFTLIGFVLMSDNILMKVMTHLIHSLREVL